MNKAQELARQIDMLEAYKKDLRKTERALRAREEALSSQFQVPNTVQSLRSNLMSGIPAHLMPLNIGSLSEVSWNFWYSARFALAGVTQLDNTIRVSDQFQVSEGSAFIITHISVNFKQGASEAGYNAPWAIMMEDVQSTRKFNNEPMPIQAFGKKGRPTKIITPFLVMPSAFLKTTLTCEVDVPYAVPSQDVNIEVLYHGLRMRIDQSSKILSTIYR